MEGVELKAAMRAAVRERRAAWVAALDAQARALAFRTPPTPLRALIESAGCIAGYAALADEADPAALLAWAAAAGRTIALPYVERRAVPMRFLRWQPGAPLLPGPMGLMQPDIGTAEEVAPDLILAPLIAFDRRLHRLGQGAAFYDRAFARFPAATRIGIGWSVQEVPAVPDDPWDMPLDAVLTEREWIA